MGALIVHDDVLELISAKLDKYETLVWYARKDKDPASPFWDSVPADIKEGAFNAIAKAEEQYPDDLDELNDPEIGAWTHGFNSGILAALRYVLHASADPEEAEEEFPELYT